MVLVLVSPLEVYLTFLLLSFKFSIVLVPEERCHLSSIMINEAPTMCKPL